MRSAERVEHNLQALLKVDRPAVLRIIRTRLMLEQRGIKMKELSNYLTCSTRYAYKVLNGEPDVSSERRDFWLDRIDDAIDEILYGEEVYR